MSVDGQTEEQEILQGKWLPLHSRRLNAAARRDVGLADCNVQ